MDANRFKQIRELFEAAVDQDSGIRDAFIVKACGDDVELANEIRTLVRHRDDLTLTPIGIDFSALNKSYFDRNSENCQPEVDDPKSIGPYRVLEKLGEGGMGAVFKAEDTRSPGRIVAIKVVRNWSAGESLVRRFGKERLFQGRLNHPSIVTLFDAGRGDLGEPYLVMEYVDGLPITKYAERHHLGVRDRIRLMMRVCHAVQHAHLKSIVHRDLKPGNILVVDVEEGPLPKVIDFGVAKSLEEGGAEPALTQEHQLVGTFGYMAPEQIAKRHNDIDTRSDVFALGVILYELLVGCRPYSDEVTRRSTLSNRLGFVSTAHPQRASALARRPETTASIPECGLTEHQLERRLKGDLDLILLKAVSPDPNDRYLSALDLARDLNHFLKQEPIHARPSHPIDRVIKFVRRNRLAVAALCAIAITVLIAMVLVIASAHDARIARAEALEKNEDLTDLLYRSQMAQAGTAISDGEWRQARIQLDATPESRRGIEWRMLDRLVSGEWRTILDARSAVSVVAPQPQGAFVAIGLRNGSILLIDVQSGAVMAQSQCDGVIKAIRWRLDGGALAASTVDNAVHVFDAELNALIAPTAIPHSVSDYCFEMNGHGLVLIDAGGSLHELSLDDGARFAPPAESRQAAKSGGNTSVALSPNARWMAECDPNGMWTLRERATLQISRQWKTTASQSLRVAVSDDGDIIALERKTGAVLLANDASSQPILIATLGSGVGAISLLQTHRMAAVMDPGGRALLIDLVRGRVSAEIPIPFLGLSAISLLDNGHAILVATNDGKLRRAPTSSAYSNMWESKLSDTIYAQSKEGNSSTVVISKSGERRILGWHDGQIRDLPPVPESITAAQCVGNTLVIGLETGDILLLDADATEWRQIEAFHDAVRSIQKSPVSRELFAASAAGAVCRIDVGGSSVQAIKDFDRPPLSSFAVNAAGCRVALLWGDGVWLVADAVTGAVLVENRLSGVGASIELSESGSTVFVGGADGRLIAYDVDKNVLLWSYEGQGDPMLALCSVSPDRLAAGTMQGALVFIDAKNGEDILTLRRTDSPIICIELDVSNVGFTCAADNGDVFRYVVNPQFDLFAEN